ncbi:hypothetical protein ACOTJD_13980 [Achromobacter xylosoxidans]
MTMQFDFLYDWQASPGGVRLDSHAATWADLTIGIDGRFFTANEPASEEEPRRVRRTYVSVSVFPLAEFIAANWWPLLYEPHEKSKVPNVDHVAFNQRHWIDQHTDGFAYPKVGFFGADSSVRIIAQSTKIPNADICFYEKTQSINRNWEGLRRDKVEAALLEFIRAVADRLPANQDKVWLNDQWLRIDQSRKDGGEAKYCRLAGLLGEDPYEPGEELYDTIVRTVELLGEDMATEMCATSQVSDVVERSAWLHEQSEILINRSKAAAQYSFGLKDELQGEPLGRQPWERGYSAARKVRQLLGVSSEQALDERQSVSKLLFDLDEDAIDRVPGLEVVSGARGALFTDASGLRLSLDPQRGRLGTKFQTAATFSDFVFSTEAVISVATRSATDRQKRNRAFAAELLAPVSGIREHWLVGQPLRKNVEHVAEQFNVNKDMVHYQVVNQAPELLMKD